MKEEAKAGYRSYRRKTWALGGGIPVPPMSLKKRHKALESAYRTTLLKRTQGTT